MPNTIPEMTQEQYSRYLMAQMQEKLNAVNTLSVETQSENEWKDIYTNYMNVVHTIYNNKIPKSEFEAKYSKFYNPANKALCNIANVSSEALNWRHDCNEFLTRIDRCRPILIVADNDHDEIIQILPPIFRMADALHTDDTNPSKIEVEDGKFLTNKEVVSMVSGLFDNGSISENSILRGKAKELMRQCLTSVQDLECQIGDVIMTNSIINEFIRRKMAMDESNNTYPESTSVDVNSDNDSSSIEELGIVFK